MKYNNFFIAVALCAVMQPGITFGSDMPQIEEQQIEGQKQGGETGGRGTNNSSGGTSPKAKRDESARTGAVAAKAKAPASVEEALESGQNLDDLE